MFAAGRSAQFLQFHALLETVSHADEEAIGDFKSFHRVMHKLLVQGTEYTTEAVSAQQATKRSVDEPAQSSTHFNNTFAPSNGYLLLPESIPHHQVEFLDDGESSPYKRAHYTHDGVLSHGEFMVNHVSPRETNMPNDDSTHSNVRELSSNTTEQPIGEGGC